MMGYNPSSFVSGIQSGEQVNDMRQNRQMKQEQLKMQKEQFQMQQIQGAQAISLNDQKLQEMENKLNATKKVTAHYDQQFARQALEKYSGEDLVNELNKTSISKGVLKLAEPEDVDNYLKGKYEKSYYTVDDNGEDKKEVKRYTLQQLQDLQLTDPDKYSEAIENANRDYEEVKAGVSPYIIKGKDNKVTSADEIAMMTGNKLSPEALKAFSKLAGMYIPDKPEHQATKMGIVNQMIKDNNLDPTNPEDQKVIQALTDSLTSSKASYSSGSNLMTSAKAWVDSSKINPATGKVYTLSEAITDLSSGNKGNTDTASTTVTSKANARDFYSSVDYSQDNTPKLAQLERDESLLIEKSPKVIGAKIDEFKDKKAVYDNVNSLLKLQEETGRHDVFNEIYKKVASLGFDEVNDLVAGTPEQQQKLLDTLQIGAEHSIIVGKMATAMYGRNVSNKEGAIFNQLKSSFWDNTSSKARKLNVIKTMTEKELDKDAKSLINSGAGFTPYEYIRDRRTVDNNSNSNNNNNSSNTIKVGTDNIPDFKSSGANKLFKSGDASYTYNSNGDLFKAVDGKWILEKRGN